jgi:putative flippase GtrA
VQNAVRRGITTVANDQRFRFLVVGGINTLVGWSLFALFELLFGSRIGRFGYLVSLVLSYAIGICVAFVLHRRFVFKVQGNTLVDFGRFVLTNLVGFGLNALILPLIVETTGLMPIIAQGLSAFIVAIVSYFGHKYFSFRRA